MTNVEAQMLSTLEVLHYCERFRGKLFSFFFERAEDARELLTDLRVMHAARIRQILFTPADEELERRLELWNRAGSNFRVIRAEPFQLRTAAFIGQLHKELAEQAVPVITLPHTSQELERAVMHCCVALGAEKVFFPGAVGRLVLGGKPRSYPTASELRQALEEGVELNLSRERALFLLEQQDQYPIEIVLVEARAGASYEEVFTHSGSGTLFTRDYPNELRQATEEDVRDIVAMMAPYVQEGSLRPVSEQQLLELIPSFLIYSVNGQIVAAAAVLDYTDSYEIGKLCTLPRYQARGRARDLVRAVLNRARDQGKTFVFALTIHDYVGQFFERLGFHEVDRAVLPEQWRQSYDLSRPSRAYRHLLKK